MRKVDNELWHAAANSNINQAKIAISKGADVNMQNNHGWTPLHYAVFNNCVEIVESLISKGANVNMKDDGGKTPLHVACCYGNKEITELLISKGADVNDVSRSGNRPLQYVVMRRRPETVYCNQRECADIVQLLVSNGADIGESLQWAIENQKDETVVMLLENMQVV